jgi:Protein of unknown function (DUF1566)
MKGTKSLFVSAVGILAVSGAVIFAYAPSARATDSLDPATQPHLKSWSNVIPPAKRFVVLADFNNHAVLDRETGLVWEKTPNPIPAVGEWHGARYACINTNVGGRKGWRLPSIPELASLIDLSATAAPMLPPGHPFTTGFTSVQSVSFWSATASTELPTTVAWFVNFFDGNVDTSNQGNAPDLRVWCVRGDMNASTY